MIASINGHFEVVRYLLEQGADRDKADRNGYTSLHYSAGNGDLEIAKLLMVYGANLNAKSDYDELAIDMTEDEEIRQAICDEPGRRMDEAPGKRCVEPDRHSYAASSASAQQEDDKGEEQNTNVPVEGEAEEGKVADEDQDSESSSDEDGN